MRACFALTPQDAALLAGTVRDNLLMGRAEATEAELWDALYDAVRARDSLMAPVQA